MQAKLRIGQPHDIYEQEADRVAEQVMRMPDLNNKGFKAYREEGGYKKDLNVRLREMVSKIKLEPK